MHKQKDRIGFGYTPKTLKRRYIDEKRNAKKPEVYDFVVGPMETYGNPQGPVPERIVLLRPKPDDPSFDQLFIDQIPIPDGAWRYDPHDQILSWRHLYGGGHFYISHDGLSASGNVGEALDSISVTAKARAQFLCDVALDCGATYESSGGSVIGFVWDTSSDKWKKANWIEKRLLITYTVTPGTPLDPPEFSFEFTDKKAGRRPWEPILGTFQASLNLGVRQKQMVWNLAFKSNIKPDEGKGECGPEEPGSVYPWWMQAVEDAAAMSIDGVLQTEDQAPKEKLVGIKGVRANALATGYYRLSPDLAPFGIFNEQLTISGNPAGDSFMSGNKLVWSGLGAEHQKRTGLPGSGVLQFSEDGTIASNEDGTLRVHCLNAADSINAIKEHIDLHSTIHRHFEIMSKMASEEKLDIYGLLAMNPFAQGEKGDWGDVVNETVRKDLGEIMNSFIPEEMWKLLFPDTPQPTLKGELALVAHSPVEGVPNPPEWYRSLATAVMTEGLARGSDENCKNLNGPRAEAWLKTEVAKSKVYYTHSQKLFRYEWAQRFPLIMKYWEDQINKAADYAPVIGNRIQSQVDDIEKNVEVSPDDDPKLKEKLKAQVKSAGEYAKNNQLFWAFAYYTYNTAPGVLANIAMQIGHTGSGDGTTLARLLQQHASVLTALDPSGHFERQYTNTLNIFLATNILPSMYGFTKEATNFDMIKKCLKEFVEINIRNEDEKIRAAAQMIKKILDDKDADQMLHDSIEVLRNVTGFIQDTLALPIVAERFVKKFSDKYPKFSVVAEVFSSLFIGVVTSLAVFNLIRHFQEWKELSEEEKAEVIKDSIQFGLQILSAVVKRGVRIAVIFSAQGMTRCQRTAAVARIVLSGEGGKGLDDALLRIGNSAARWLGDTEGTVGRIAAGRGATTAVLITGRTTTPTSVRWLKNIFGRNLEEFIALRIGPLFILAGIALSIWALIRGEGGVELAGEILNIVSGSLMLISIIGQWFVTAARVALAAFCSIVGASGVIAALAGVVLMIIQMFSKPPNPVKEFVDKYAKPAGFYLEYKAGSIDYAVPYMKKKKEGERLVEDLMMIGFYLETEKKALCCDDSGNIGRIPIPSKSEEFDLPSFIWEAETDGYGMSRIFTVAQRGAAKQRIPVLLSLMSDNTVSFQPEKTALSPSKDDELTVATQTWLTTPLGPAALTEQGDLSSLPMVIQPVKPDDKGIYRKEKAEGYLFCKDSKLVYDGAASTPFTLYMSGMAPNFMEMHDVSFIVKSVPSQEQKFGPSFGVTPSTPMKPYVLTGGLPPFLTFKKEEGTISPNGKIAEEKWEKTYDITAKNELGEMTVAFNIVVHS